MQLINRETGASPRAELVVTTHILNADAVRLHELTNEGNHGLLLRLGSGNFALANKVASANVADAQALAISASAVRSSNLFWSALLYIAVKSDDVMVAAALPSSLSVPAINVSNSKGLSLSRCRAMDDYFLDFPHD